jgi:cysteinyl-tRNA synthetase
MAVRLFVLQAQYRKPLDFTDEALAAATNGWHTLKEGLLFGVQYGEQLGWQDSDKRQTAAVERFQTAVDDDFNFAEGLAVLFELAKELGREGNILVHEGKTRTSPQELEAQWHTLVELAQVFGLEAQAEDIRQESASGLSDAEIETLIQQRTEARKRKDFEMSDRIRDELKAQGITLIDQPGGVTRWHRN